MASSGPVERPQKMFQASLRQASRWPVVGVLALLALVLGYIGWAQYFAARPETKSVWDLLYLDVQLFFLQSGAVPGPIPVVLEIARFLAFSVAAFAAVKGVALLARDQVAALRRRFLRDHTVIVGLGEKGSLLTEAFVREGVKVVAVEANPSNDSIPELRALGVNVLVGDGADPTTLASAGVARAARLVAVADDDATNAEIATRAPTLVAGRRGAALVCIAHVVDPELASLLQLEEVSAGSSDAFRLDFFNVPEAGARLVLEEVPPDRATDDPHVVVIGTGPLADQVRVQARRLLGGREPVAVETAAAVDRAELARADAVYVCPADEGTAITDALAVRTELHDRATPVVAALRRLGGMAALLERSDALSHRGELHAIAVLEETCRPEVVLGGTFELLARAIHDEYIRTRAREGVAPGSEPSTQPWATLPETLRESNRDQAGHIGVKLRAIDCALVPATDAADDLAPSSFSFTDDEIARLAEMEHERWVTDRRRNGWTFAPGDRDVERKTSPHLAPWADLTEEIREYDRVAVREIPQFLARVGYRIVRVEAPSS